MRLRLAREGEAEVVLRLICRAFGLDFEAALPLYFDDPLFHDTLRFLLLDGEEAVSTATVIPVQMQMGGWFAHCAGIAGVCTEPALQGKGYAGRLMELLLPCLRERGFETAALLAEDPRLYQKHGFGLGGVRWSVRVNLPSGQGVEAVAAKPAEMAAAYRDHGLRRLGAVQRGESRWRNGLSKTRTAALGQGYITYRESPGHLAVHELLPDGPSPEALALFSGREVTICGWWEDVEPWQKLAVAPPTKEELFHFRVLDAPAALAHYPGARLSLYDWVMPENNREGPGETLSIAEFSESLVRGPSIPLNLPKREFSLFLSDQF